MYTMSWIYKLRKSRDVFVNQVSQVRLHHNPPSLALSLCPFPSSISISALEKAILHTIRLVNNVNLELNF